MMIIKKIFLFYKRESKLFYSNIVDLFSNILLALVAVSWACLLSSLSLLSAAVSCCMSNCALKALS